MKFNIEVYVDDKLVRVIPNLSKKKIEWYAKVYSVHNGYYKVVEVK